MSYKWVVNQLKLSLVKAELLKEKEVNPNLEITEALIKERYIRRGGLVAEGDIEVVHDVSPSNPLVLRTRVIKKKK